MKKILLLISVLALASFAQASRLENAIEKVPFKDAKEVRLNLELGAGEFTITGADISDAAEVEINYNPDRVRYYIDSEVRRDICFVDMESEHRSRTSVDTDDNLWDIKLSTKYPYSSAKMN